MNLVLIYYEARLSPESQFFSAVKRFIVTGHLTVHVSVQCTLHTLTLLSHNLKTRVKNNFRRKYAHEYLQLMSQTFKMLKLETKQTLVKWTKKKLVNSKATQAPNQEKYVYSKEPSFSFHEAQAWIMYRMYGVEESEKLRNAYGTRRLRKEL